ncbi:MAG: SGNH/GDSL hydrolase family protein [Gammaproteobacteria bacterium]|nr:SGNH/GDSL hydrolase family protein [Gammaproteobacteria bacterium]MDH3810301.1 SGNH/GDSL hydrolase family protein [Gammaproteobacteria bacterium]
MKTLKRIMVALLALLPLATGMALAEPEHGYDRIFIFGASFMDSGNHFAVTGESAHPPFDPTAFISYNIGGHRPSNGHTWVEVLAQEMNLAKWAKPAYRDPAFGNYAYAYGRAREVPYAIGKSLGTQVTDWISNGYCTNVPMADTLFIVDGAYADMFDIKAAVDAGDMDAAFTIMQEVADVIEANIRTLYGCGARNFMFVYIPPAEYSPLANQGFPPELVPTPLSEAYNYELYLELFDPSDDDPLPADINIAPVNFFDIFKDIMAMRESLGFTNVTDTCITYYVTKGAFCKNRDEYFWWDMVHPTKEVHALLGRIALMYLPELD